MSRRVRGSAFPVNHVRISFRYASPTPADPDRPLNQSLSSPLAFRTGLTARNRVVLAPMTNQQSHEDGTLSDAELHWLRSRAEGGFGIVMTCALHVAKDGQGWPGELGIFDDAHLPGLTRLATSLRDAGAASIAQIFHGGVRADSAASGTMPWSADTGEGFRAATEDDLRRVIGQFTDAAHRAEVAGFDGVEIHGAHGYLLTQFLSREQNHRTDRWGGSLENRARLSREVTRAIRARVAPSFTVGIRISPEDNRAARGLDLDESLETARWLVDDGIDFLHLSLWQAQLNSRKRPDEHPIPLFRAVVPSDVKLIAAGAVWTPTEGEDLLRLGADGIALARAAIANPDWPIQAADLTWEPRRPPLSVDDLLARGLSRPFVEYMRAWKGFVSE